MQRALENLSFQLSGAQLGITVSSLALGFVVDNAIGPLLRPALQWIPGIENGGLAAATAALALALATLIQMVLGELAPKNLAIARPLATAYFFVPIMVFVNTAVGPVIRMLNAVANSSMRIAGIEPRENIEGFRSVAELRDALRWATREGGLEGIEYEVLDRALGLEEKTVRDIMLPRSQVIAIEATNSLAELAHLANKTGFSRFPVVGRETTEYVGIAHAKDVLAMPAEARAATPISAKVQQALVVPAARDLRSLLLEMQGSQHALAIVDDEFGHAAGIVTLEDIIEELLGHIEDEHDRPLAIQVKPLGHGSYEAAGQIRRDELHTATGFPMPHGRFETLAGLLLTLFQQIPNNGESVVFRGWTLTVLTMDKHRITRVRIDAPSTRQAKT